MPLHQEEGWAQHARLPAQWRCAGAAPESVTPFCPPTSVSGSSLSSQTKSCARAAFAAANLFVASSGLLKVMFRARAGDMETPHPAARLRMRARTAWSASKKPRQSIRILPDFQTVGHAMTSAKIVLLPGGPDVDQTIATVLLASVKPMPLSATQASGRVDREIPRNRIRFPPQAPAWQQALQLKAAIPGCSSRIFDKPPVPLLPAPVLPIDWRRRSCLRNTA